MLIQRLKEYAELNLAEDLAHPAFEPQPVPWLLVIGPDGAFRDFRATSGGTVKKGKKEFSIPKSYKIPKPAGARTAVSVSYPLLAVDTGAYVLGPGPWTKEGQEPKERRHHEAFKALLAEAADRTGDPALKACAAFYEHPEGFAMAQAEWQKEKRGPGQRCAFQLAEDSLPVFQRAAAREFWRARYGQAAGSRDARAAVARCLCCGVEGPVAHTHEKIKGIPGGQGSGLSLVSFDKEAFESHGWEKGGNSAVCSACAEKYVRAMNHVLNRRGVPVRSDGTPTGAGSVVQGGVVFAFWMRAPDSFSPMDLLREPSLERIEKLFEASSAGLRAEENAFYAVALSANGGRMVVRQWIEITLSEAKRNLQRWFGDLEIVLARDQWRDGTIIRNAGEVALPPSLYELCLATAREAKEVAPHVPVTLVRAALSGGALPPSVLEACLRRIRLGSGRRHSPPPAGRPRKLHGEPGKPPKFTPARAGLIRCALNRSRREGEPTMETALARDCRDAGYVCGRLLAVLARAQYLAVGDVDATVVDRFYGRASVAPQSVFPVLLKLARHHLAKADDKYPGVGTNLQRDIEEILSLVPRRADACPDLPNLLSLPMQGRFALGFYHQQGWYRAESERKRQAREERLPQPVSV